MLYFKHDELATKYHVSLKTVHNWISATKLGKLDLTLYKEGNRYYIANTPQNTSIIWRLIEKGRKYRNTRAVKSVEPKSKFYSIYTEAQVYDIVTSLEIHHEIPRQYNYFQGGAGYWDEYTDRLVADDTPNIVNSTINLLRANQGYLDSLFVQYKQINVIDIGVGNAQPVKEFLKHLLEERKLGRYIALDISPDILEIARRNIQEWFGDQVRFEGHKLDITQDRFTDLLIREHTKEDAKDTLNLVLLLGGTLSNMRTPDSGFKTIHDSMGINDLLIHSAKLDTQSTRHYFDFDLQPERKRLAAIHGLVVDLLNIDPAFYTVELGYDPHLKQRFEHIRLKVALTITFTFKDGKRTIELEKDDTILTWRYSQQTAADVMSQFDSADFYPIHTSQTDDHEYILTVSRVKHG
ncbi:L-histidine N(alpha)-methyltransferase [Nocardia sp. CA-135953]|uniref:L-histidine N(alpha)-methyltransferase n=1 Tax=Nocardia sp. CA-135953 TaxID=3239978 RepID=UPI003D96665A